MVHISYKVYTYVYTDAYSLRLAHFTAGNLHACATDNANDMCAPRLRVLFCFYSFRFCFITTLHVDLWIRDPGEMFKFIYWSNKFLPQLIICDPNLPKRNTCTKTTIIKALLKKQIHCKWLCVCICICYKHDKYRRIVFVGKIV